MNLIDSLIVVAYILITFLVGFIISKKAAKGLNSYFLGDNNLKWWMLGFSNSAGMFDVSGAAWMVSMVFIYGINVYWQQWAWPVWNQVVLMMFLSIWLRRSNVMTGAQWINYRFGNDKGSSASHIITVAFAVIVAIAFIAYMTVGIGSFASTILPWNLSFNLGSLHFSNENAYAIIIILLTTIYSVKGGMYSVVATEIIQYFIMIVSCICITYLAINLVDGATIKSFFPDGWADLKVQAKVDLNWNEKWPAVNKVIDNSGFRDFGLVFGMMAFKGIWASFSGPVPSYDMQRILSTRSPQEASKMNAFTMIVLYFPLYLLVASVLVLSIHYYNIAEIPGANDTPQLDKLLSIVIAKLPVGVKGLIMAGMLAAFMSTFSAFVNSGPAYIVNDIYKKYFNSTASDKTYINISYLSSAIFVVVGLLLGLSVKNISQMFDIITGGLYAGFVVPNALKWIWHRLNGWGYFAGMVTGIVISLLSILFWGKLTEDIDFFGYKINHLVMSFPINLVLSLLAAILVSIITKPVDDNVLAHFYRTTRPWGFWSYIRNKINQQNNLALGEPVQKNKNFAIDFFNVGIGIVWQMCLIILPIYLVIRRFDKALIFALLLLLTSTILYFSWYKRLNKI